MSDLQSRLQASLGEAYQIDRELGGGGMSRVFLARDTALGRKVVIKVLPPEMAASVNIERFRREIQLAASLQHPHIVPVHAAAQVDELFYYTMPLVEGESLRAKLAREGELPIGDTIRILRDVADGLAYAHAHGVVHRDIKPDNILISGHHAVVTDFGVAKAVSAATGGSSLTSVGVALGTPAYMAPEQAAADPHVDHRADLYAVGAMAYEMLSGHPPFSGMSPQQVLAAHVTTRPVPLASQRESVPPALNELVMRCLEKKPADRVQRAEDLLDQLQSMTTPSGGMAPTGVTAAITSGAAKAIRRSHPVRVAVVFALVAVAVLTTVFELRNRMGLPDWVFIVAVLLLAIGLPIVLYTGRMERARVVAATTGMQLPPQMGATRLFTWRRAISGGIAAFVALAIVVAAYTLMRVGGIGSIGTLQAKGLIKDKQPILLAEFDNRSLDSTLGPTLTEAFRVDLSQSQSVKLVDAQAVMDALTRMQRPATDVLTPALAREIALREGVPALVVGEIDPVGKSYLVSVRVVSASSGAVLAALRETAGGDAELIPALDRLSRALRERIGESLVSIRQDEPLAHVTTASLDALRKYTQSLRDFETGHEEAAILSLREATALDSGFAMAWRKLAVLLGNTGASYPRVVDAATRAYRHRDRLPELERQATIGYYFDMVDIEPDQSSAAYRAMLAIDPTSEIALNNLAMRLFDQHQYAEAESLAVRCVELGTFATCAFHVMRNQMALGKTAAADSILDRWRRAKPDDPNMMMMRVGLASARGDYPSASRNLDTLRTARSSSPYWQEQTAFVGAALANVQGKIAQGSELSRAAAAAAEVRGLPGNYLADMAESAQMKVRYLNGSADAIAILSAALAKHPLEALDPTDRPYPLLASTYALAGRPDEATRLMTEYARVIPPSMQKYDAMHFAALGDIQAAQGKQSEAIASYRAARAVDGRPGFEMFEIASAFGKLGQADSARDAYERYVHQGGPMRILGDVFYLAASYQRLGESYEAKGDRKKAIENYLKLADLWQNADPELQPIVKDAHVRIARLSAEH